MEALKKKIPHDPDGGLASARKSLSATVKDGGTHMQRHMDLILKILDQTEQRNEREPRQIEIEGYSDLVVGQHVELLYDSGYLVGISYEISTVDFKTVEVRDLTWEGHEFLAVLRSDNGWGKLRKSFPAAELAKMPLKIIQEVSSAALKQWVLQQMGLSG
jgi:hypothetical protein